MLNSERSTPNITNKLQGVPGNKGLFSLRCNNNQCVFTLRYGVNTLLQVSDVL